MKIIVSHSSADFDAVSSMVAARILHPDAELCLGGSVNRNVRDFLGFYLHGLHIRKPRDIDMDRVDRMIVVDTQHPSRLGPFGRLLGNERVMKIYWDHHPKRQKLETFSRPCQCHIRPVGATVTLLIEEIRRRRLPVEQLEATLFALGIYEDTGCLLHGSTCDADFEALLWLRRRGADLRIVSSFLHRGLSPAHRRLLDELTARLETVDVHGFPVALTWARCENYLEDLDVVVNRLRDMEDLRVCFVLVTMGAHTYVIARSRYEQVNVARVLKEFGGGGHLFAASASVHNRDAEELRGELLEILQRVVRPQITAREIMNSPVRTIPQELSVEEARQVMLRFGYTGLPVTAEAGLLVGVISRSDTEKAERHGLGHAPVKGFMSRDLITAAPDEGLLDLQRKMIGANVGRLPVLEEGRLVGILTTNDLLRTLHAQIQLPRDFYVTFGESGRQSGPESLEDLIMASCSGEVVELLESVGEEADRLAAAAYLVGGSVRDLVLGRSGKDLDVVVEGDAVPLAKALGERLGVSVTEFPRYKTASLRLADGLGVDFVTTRREFYEYPAAPPTVDTENVRLDLYRRDFTINAMAVSLNREGFGRLHDYYGGYRDLQRRLIRVLHNLSFVEDPTRIFRALRFRLRLAFEIDEGTESFLKEALSHGVLDHLKPEVLFEQLRLCLLLPDSVSMIKGMGQLGILRSLDPAFALDGEIFRRLTRVETLRRIARPLLSPRGRDFWFPPFAVAFASSAARRAAVERRCRLTRRTRQLLTAVDEVLARSGGAFGREACEKLPEGRDLVVRIAVAGLSSSMEEVELFREQLKLAAASRKSEAERED